MKRRGNLFVEPRPCFFAVALLARPFAERPPSGHRNAGQALGSEDLVPGQWSTASLARGESVVERRRDGGGGGGGEGGRTASPPCKPWDPLTGPMPRRPRAEGQGPRGRGRAWGKASVVPSPGRPTRKRRRRRLCLAPRRLGRRLSRRPPARTPTGKSSTPNR